MSGVRDAGLIVAINDDVTAHVFDFADIGIVGDYRVAVPALYAELSAKSPAGND